MTVLRSCRIKTTAFAGLLLASVSQSHAAPLTYQIELDGKRAGQIVHEYSRSPDGGHTLKLSTQIRTKAFLSKVQIDSILEETISADGYLDSASNKVEENKKTYWTKIQRSGGGYLAFTAHMKTPEEIETEELAGLAKEVIATVVPYAGEAMTVAGILLSDGKETPQHKRLTTDLFDTSLISLPLYWQSKGYSLPQSLRIIDTEEMSIFKADIKDLGDTPLSTGSQNMTARHIRLEIKDAAPVDLWLARAAGTEPAHFLKISGKDDGTAYTVNLTARN